MLRDAIEVNAWEFRDQYFDSTSKPARIIYFTLNQNFSFLWFEITTRKGL